MYILTYKPFVDIFSFHSLIECIYSGDAYIFENKDSLRNGIISSCPLSQRDMKVYKLKGNLEDICVDNIKPFNDFNSLIIDKHVIFNKNFLEKTHVYSLLEQDWFKQYIVNFYTDENNRSTLVFTLYAYSTPSVTEYLNDSGVKYIIKKSAYFIFLESEEEIYELLMYLSINDIKTYKNLLKYYSFDNYDINCTKINLELLKE